MYKTFSINRPSGSNQFPEAYIKNGLKIKPFSFLSNFSDQNSDQNVILTNCMLKLTRLYRLFHSFLLLLAVDAHGQVDTIRSTTFFKDSIPFIVAENEDRTTIMNHAFPYISSLEANYLDNLLFSKTMKARFNPKDSTFRIAENLIMNNCSRYMPPREKEVTDFFNPPAKYYFGRGLEIAHVNVPNDPRFNVNYANFPNNLTIFDDSIKDIAIGFCSGRFTLYNNVIGEQIAIYGGHGYTKASDIRIDDNEFLADQSRVGINDLKIEGSLFYGGNWFRHQQISFSNDTLSTRFYFTNSKEDLSKKKGYRDYVSLQFTNCVIDGGLAFEQLADTVDVTFRYCTFGSGAEFLNIAADKVAFISCGKIPSYLIMRLAPNKSNGTMEFYNTDFKEAQLVYSPGMSLAFTNETIPDNISNTYQSLLGKFKTDNKPESYKLLDIEYRNYKAAHGTRWDKFSNWVNLVWWNYGYAKLRILLWALGFLLLFWILNSLLWTKLQQLYPMPLKFDLGDKLETPVMYNLRKLILIFFYTAFIFFSVKIEFNQLTYRKIAITLYFFTQFLIGLICLFFIVNALLKIG